VAGEPSRKNKSSLSRDEGIVRNHINPTFDKRPVGSINRRDVQGLMSKWSPHQAPRTVDRQYDVLRAVFKLCR
jgi:hypothetical protein